MKRTNKLYYLNAVFPYVSAEVKERALLRYPDVRLSLAPEDGFTPLGEHNLVMLVGMTGSGKSTTLRHLREMDTFAFVDAIPSRRDLADLVLIPSAQVIRQEAIYVIKDRVYRFRYTRYAHQEFVPGGTAEVFAWLDYRTGSERILSEGVRGAEEIKYALQYTRWRIAELWVDPVQRLQRLSQRGEAFDQVNNADAEDLSFLPADRADEVRALLASGNITPQAIATVREETVNYGGAPYDIDNNTANYRCFPTNGLTPQQVAASVAQWIQQTEQETS